MYSYLGLEGIKIIAEREIPTIPIWLSILLTLSLICMIISLGFILIGFNEKNKKIVNIFSGVVITCIIIIIESTEIFNKEE